MIKLAHAKSSVALAPALVETYSRLLVYMEIESLGIKGFISKPRFSSVDTIINPYINSAGILLVAGIQQYTEVTVIIEITC